MCVFVCMCVCVCVRVCVCVSISTSPHFGFLKNMEPPFFPYQILHTPLL